MSIQFLLALQLISDIVLFVAVIFLLAIVGRNSWKKYSSPPNVPNAVDKQTVADLERLISESQAATAHLIKAMDESRRALKEAVCEVEEKEFRIIQRESRIAKRETQTMLAAAAGRQPASDRNTQEPRIEAGKRDKNGKGLAGSEITDPEKRQGNSQGATKLIGAQGPGQCGDRDGDYKAVIEMARKGMTENEIMENSELTEAEISLVLELGRKREEFN